MNLQQNQRNGVETVGSWIWCFFQYIYIEKERIAGPKNGHTTRKSPGRIYRIRALIFILCKEHPHKLYKNESARESKKWCWNGWLLNMVFLQYIYIDKEQIAGPQNGHATRKSPGHIYWIRALVFILCKEDTPKLYKNESATESEKRCLNGCLYNMVFFLTKYLRHYKPKELIADPKSDHVMRASCYHVSQIV
jgi:hypothetical protein